MSRRTYTTVDFTFVKGSDSEDLKPGMVAVYNGRLYLVVYNGTTGRSVELGDLVCERIGEDGWIAPKSIEYIVKDMTVEVRDVW